MAEVRKVGSEYIWIDCGAPTQESQDREIVVGTGRERLMAGDEEDSGMTGMRPMCINYEMRQKQVRQVEVTICDKYKAEPKLTPKKATGVGLIAIGIFIGLSGGTGALVVGALVAAGGLYVTLTESASLDPAGCRPGQHLGTERKENPGPWTDSGAPYKIYLPPPFPC